MDSASNHLVAELEEPSGTRTRRLRRRALALVRALWGDVEIDADLVIRRRGSGAEILRTAADLGDPQFLLETVRRDLETKTVEEFVREWCVLD
ncbi:hypothetical protein [Cryobacterium sp. TMS1-13-1]|uniref:hypothetical protein n=1 Tax=Cryobacterium sp. TMS1-13-1 TaxID=1259220 RepID=UPI00106A1EC3|nr:hypothetical protein [Cryobacterium sp. TMS1-13-1]TFD24901.1 hypothetical protein E3T31_01180 [Cryobacterium sp. TMS1-13-1]